MIKAIKQFIEDRKLFKQAAKDLNNKDLQAKAKYAYEHRGDTMITLIDGLAIVCAILIFIGIVWCWMWIISQQYRNYSKRYKWTAEDM